MATNNEAPKDLDKEIEFWYSEALKNHINPAELESKFGVDSDSTNYTRLGAFLSAEKTQRYFRAVMEEANRLVGKGTYENSLQTFLTRLDRYGNSAPPINTLNVGYTFITRPRFNMTEANLRQHALTAALCTRDDSTVSFMIRALMDTQLSRGLPLFNNGFGIDGKTVFTPEMAQFAAACKNGTLVDPNNPFLIPLCNGLRAINGFPDLNMETETVESDFFGSDFMYVRGSDMLRKSGELSLTFTDVQGSIIHSIIYYWCLMMSLQARGTLMAYPDDIYEQRLNYTVSIYRFVTDPSRRYLRWWAKATGCYPRSVPIGALFNISEGDVSVPTAHTLSVPFVYSKIEVNDPGIIQDFNRLVHRYQPNITNVVNPRAYSLGVPSNTAHNANLSTFIDSTEDLTSEPFLEGGDGLEVDMNDSTKFYDVDHIPKLSAAPYNFIGLPFITTNEPQLRLSWRTNGTYLASAGFTSLNPFTFGQKNDYLDKLEEDIKDDKCKNIAYAVERAKNALSTPYDEDYNDLIIPDMETLPKTSSVVSTTIDESTTNTTNK